MRKNRRLPWWKKALFALICLAIGLLAAEGSLRLAGYQSPTSDPYESFVQHRRVFGPEGDQYRTRRTRRKFFHDQTFARTKAPGTFRIAAVGGSVTYGYLLADPKRDNYAAALGRHLAARTGVRTVEVINAGGLSYGSYRLTGVVDELVGYAPDMILIMMGHNEFLEPRHYARFMGQHASAPAIWQRSRLAQALRHLSEVMRPQRQDAPGEKNFLLASESIDERYIVRDAAEIQYTLEHFNANINRMLDRCRDAGVPVVLCIEAANLRDFPPFRTEPTGELPRAEMRKRLAQATVLYELSRHIEALKVAADVLTVAPRAAVFHYMAAKCLDAIGDKANARQEYILAKDTDAFPHRSLSSFNDSLRRIARQRNVALYDTEAAFMSASPDGIPGANLFLDQCHPTGDAHGRIARDLVELLARRRPDLAGQRATAPQGVTP